MGLIGLSSNCCPNSSRSPMCLLNELLLLPDKQWD
jgi:hypothetical protein